MGNYKYYIVHCTATPFHMDVTKGHIQMWHMAPKDVYDQNGKPTGEVIYMEKTYKSRNDLPDEYINGMSIKKLVGNGWTRTGYERLIMRCGSDVVMHEVDYDDIISYAEMTWGALGVNHESKHVCLVGGHTQDGKKVGLFDFMEIYNTAMYLKLQQLIKHEVARHPHVLVGGHNQFNQKTCPNFDMENFCRLIGIPEQNILKTKPFNY